MDVVRVRSRCLDRVRGRILLLVIIADPVGPQRESGTVLHLLPFRVYAGPRYNRTRPIRIPAAGRRRRHPPEHGR